MAKTAKTTKKIATAQPAKKVASKKSPKAPAKDYKLNVGDKCPSFSMSGTSETEVSLKSLKGSAFVLYFYPKDNTPGCTLEGHDFNKNLKAFSKAGVQVFGVSRDAMKSHEKFKEKCSYQFDLLTDEDGEACRAFDVWQMKSLYGKKFEGIERSTFLVDAAGKVREIWRKVKVAAHADEVLKAANAL